MPTVREMEDLIKGMREDPRTRIVGSVYILGALLVKVGIIGCIVSPHSKAFYYVMLLGMAAFILLLCCGWTVKSSMNFFRDLTSFLFFCVALVIYLGITTGIVFPLVSEYNRENKVNFNITDANLSQFNLSNTTTLDYNLTVKVVVGPNRKKQVAYYGPLQAWASYRGHNFTTSLSLPPFYLGGKSNHSYNSSTVILQPLVFQGRYDQLILIPDALKRYQQDQAAGRFSIDVTLSHSGFRGHQQLKGVDIITLEELPLPNATSGWSDHAGAADARRTVVTSIIIMSVSTFVLLCCFCCCCCAFIKQDTKFITWCPLCTLFPLIVIAIFIPDFVRALKTSDGVKLSISNATLTQFDFPSTAINNTLAYSLSLAITVGPYEKKTGVYFDKMEAVAFYQGQNFTYLPLSPLYLQGRQQDGSRTVILRPVLRGQQVLVLPGDGLKHYQKETASRRYNILVTLSYSGIRTDDVCDSNGTLSMVEGNGKRLKGVSSFELRVPLLANDSRGTPQVSSGSGGVLGQRRVATLSSMISGFLAYAALCL